MESGPTGGAFNAKSRENEGAGAGRDAAYIRLIRLGRTAIEGDRAPSDSEATNRAEAVGNAVPAVSCRFRKAACFRRNNDRSSRVRSNRARVRHGAQLMMGTVRASMGRPGFVLKPVGHRVRQGLAHKLQLHNAAPVQI
ncbi:hypothetical protein ZHAS_00005580 [Anopheles sinensis]|uniref:Uncharacterized protein n=1 Tax=Anopheles sinensis TaxID=74873 RepID=A0A084VJW6_ANOSI|nr:hypothetical protein ZHAS_00005580 [Anopheles sinensis]